MSRRSIISDEDLLKGAQAIAADMKLPDGGRIKLARIIDDHLAWFERARGRGLEWSDIVAVLARAGATRSDGRPLSRGHVSSLVWRKQRGSNAPAPVQVAKPREEAGVPPARTPSKRTGWLSGIDLPAADHAPSPDARVSKPSRRRAQKHGGDVAPLPPPDPSSGREFPQTDGDKMLAFMRRAARLRRDE
ncbi:hypothetical protein ACFPOB_29480 [Bosea eneae]|uniref:Uncharacterized protein n=1 Tax=Bosea eneae TaxID=151454 RepID=A0ABW0J209_9HYPH